MTRRTSLVAVCCSNASRSSELDDSSSVVLLLTCLEQIDVVDGDADLIAHRTNQPNFFGDELARLFANAVDRPQKSFFRFDRKNREETVIALLRRFGLTQLLIARIGLDVLEKDRLTGLRHPAC